jgi:hypothetical protein
MWERADGRTSVVSVKGRLCVVTARVPAGSSFMFLESPGYSARPASATDFALPGAIDRAGFAFGSAAVPGLVAYTELRVPYYAETVLAAVLPLVWLLRRRAARRLGHCPKCGYDLRATPDRCRECGMVPGGADGRAAR